MLPGQRVVQRVRQLADRRLERARGPVRPLFVRAVPTGVATVARWGHATALPTTGASPADLSTAPASPHCASQFASIR